LRDVLALQRGVELREVWELELGVRLGLAPWALEKRTTALPRDRSNDSPRVSETDIAARAFHYYCERGRQHGADLEDWLRAERELSMADKPAGLRAR
jgi:hypothetical protein